MKTFREVASEVHSKHRGEYSADGKNVAVTNIVATMHTSPEIWSSILDDGPTLRLMCQTYLGTLRHNEREAVHQGQQSDNDTELADYKKMKADRASGGKRFEEAHKTSLFFWVTTVGKYLCDCRWEDLDRSTKQRRSNISNNLKAFRFESAVKDRLYFHKNKTVGEAISIKTLRRMYKLAYKQGAGCGEGKCLPMKS
jgi:hypothetical protein